MSRISRLEDQLWELRKEVGALTMPDWIIPEANAAGVKPKHRDRFYRESLKDKDYRTGLAGIAIYYKAWKRENK